MMATTVVTLNGWCKDPYRNAREAILDLDLRCQDEPDHAANILGCAWTAIVLLLQPKGVPAAQWMSPMAKFHKLNNLDRRRVLDAVEMRLRAFERAAA